MFGEDIENLIGRWNIVNADIVSYKFIPDEVKVKLNMFQTSIKNRVGG